MILKGGLVMDKIVQCIEKTLGHKVDIIRKIENVTNNTVFHVEALGEEYIFKLFRSKDWPENGKLSYVNSLLTRHHISCAKLVEFNRDDSEFPCGFLIERKLQGTCAEQMYFSNTEEVDFYVRLAELISLIHSIPIYNFGYIGYGQADYDSLSSFFEDEFDNRANALIEMNVYDKFNMEKMKELFFKGLNKFDNLPSVLCHGDLSKKNVIISDSGELILIDWDDAMSYNWMADISRLTFWMKMNYSKQNYSILKKAFIENYNTQYRKVEFDIFERAFHIYIGIDCLSYHINTGDKMMQNKIMEYLDLLLNK